jgi:hypothetical protein
MFWNGNTASDGLSGNGNAPHPSLPRKRGRVREGARRGQWDAVDAHRPRDVLDLLLAQVLKAEIELVAHLVAHDAADADAARFSQGFEACGDIDAIAVDVVTLDDDVAEIDTDAKLDAAFLGDTAIALGERTLDFDRAAHRIDDAGELDQQPVAGGLDDAPAMRGDLGI